MLATKAATSRAFQNARRKAKRYGIDPKQKGWLWRLTLALALKKGYTRDARVY